MTAPVEGNAMSRLVLVVEDEPATAEMLALHLQQRGYEYLCVEDGATAITTALARQPAAIVLDLDLPGVEGSGVLQILRAAGCTAPVVVTSGYTADLPPSVRGEIQTVLTKPYRLEELDGALATSVRSDPAASSS